MGKIYCPGGCFFVFTPSLPLSLYLSVQLLVFAPSKYKGKTPCTTSEGQILLRSVSSGGHRPLNDRVSANLQKKKFMLVKRLSRRGWK